MAQKNTIAAPIVKAVVDILEDLEFSAMNACRYVGIDVNELVLPHGRIPEIDFYNLMTMVNNLCNRQTLALELGDRFLPTTTGVFGFSLITAKSYIDMLERAQQHKAYISDTFEMTMQKQPNHVEVSMQVKLGNTDTDYFILDWATASAVKTCRWILGDKNINPIEICLTRPEPDNLASYQEYFQCPLKFNAPQLCLKMPISAAERKNPSCNDQLDNQISQELERIIETRSQPGIVHRVREEIKALLPQGDVAMDVIAKRYSFSERTLLRRLKEEGYTFQGLIDDIRKETSKSLLEKSNTSIQDIAYSLGFKDASTFYRAFKRWYNQTPAQYRKSYTESADHAPESAIRSSSQDFHKIRKQQ